MSIMKRFSGGTCLISLCALAACGGGGGGGGGDSSGVVAAPTAAQLAVGNIAVEAGTSTGISATSHAVNTTAADASGTMVYDVDTLEEVRPTADQFQARFVFSQANTAKYLLEIVDKTGTSNTRYACASSSWTATELVELAKDDGVTSYPPCPATGVTIDKDAHQIVFKSVVLPSTTTPSLTLTVSANVSWPAPTQALGHLRILSDTSDVPQGSYVVMTGENDANYNGLVLKAAFAGTVINGKTFGLTVLYPQGDGSKLLVTASSFVNLYGCLQGDWTPSEKNSIAAKFNVPVSNLHACTDQTLSFDAAAKRITFTGLLLPDLAGSTKQLELSFDRTL